MTRALCDRVSPMREGGFAQCGAPRKYKELAGA